MIFNEEVDRIKSIMGVISESSSEHMKDKIMGLIKSYGLSGAAKLIGGYDVLEKLIGKNDLKQMKLDVIMKYVNNGWVNLNESGDSFIYDVTEDEEEQIEYLSRSGAVVVGYRKIGDEWENISEYTIWYEYLPDIVFDKIFELIVEDNI